MKDKKETITEKVLDAQVVLDDKASDVLPTWVPDSKTVLINNKLNVLEIGTTVYIPYISIIDNIYETRECVIENIWDIVENNVITIFYTCKISNTDNIGGEKMTLNILANVFKTNQEATKELNVFLSKQIDALKSHSIALEKQLDKNKEHINMFEKKIK